MARFLPASAPDRQCVRLPAVIRPASYLRPLIERSEFLVAEHDIGGGDIFFQMMALPVPGMGSITGLRFKHPGQRDLRRRGLVLLGDAIQQRTRAWPDRPPPADTRE